jgi:hypothetical protein
MPLRDRRRRPLIRRRSLLSRGGHSTGPKEGLQKIKKAIYTAVGQERAIPQTLPIARNANIFFFFSSATRRIRRRTRRARFYLLSRCRRSCLILAVRYHSHRSNRRVFYLAFTPFHFSHRFLLPKRPIAYAVRREEDEHPQGRSRGNSRGVIYRSFVFSPTESILNSMRRNGRKRRAISLHESAIFSSRYRVG